VRPRQTKDPDGQAPPKPPRHFSTLPLVGTFRGVLFTRRATPRVALRFRTTRKCQV